MNGPDEEGGTRVPLREHEPFATIRRHPWRFWIGIPAVFFGGMGLGFLFVERSLSLAIAVQLAVQTGGFLWLYLPVARRRWRELGKEVATREDEVAGGGSDI